MNWFDIFILLVTLYAIVRGYRSGFIKQVASLAGLIAGAIIAGKVSTIIYPYIKQAFQFSESVITSASYIIAFILILLFFYFIGTMIETILRAIKMGTINKIAGSFLCVIKWYIIISIILNLIMKVDNNGLLITESSLNKSYTAHYIQNIAPSIIPFLRFKI